MGKITNEEKEYREAAEIYQAEASKNALAAFTEGYLMGIHYAEKIFSEGSDENKNK